MRSDGVFLNSFSFSLWILSPHNQVAAKTLHVHVFVLNKKDTFLTWALIYAWCENCQYVVGDKSWFYGSRGFRDILLSALRPEIKTLELSSTKDWENILTMKIKIGLFIFPFIVWRCNQNHIFVKTVEVR